MGTGWDQAQEAHDAQHSPRCPFCKGRHEALQACEIEYSYKEGLRYLARQIDAMTERLRREALELLDGSKLHLASAAIVGMESAGQQLRSLASLLSEGVDGLRKDL